MDKEVTPIRGVSGRRAFLAAALVAGAGLAAGQSSLVGVSPFLPAGSGPAGSAARPADTFELAGVAATGSEVEVCIFERATKRSRWIAVGETQDGIKVLRYDGATDHATVTVEGAVKELYLRKASVASNGVQAPPVFAPTFAPPVQAAPAMVQLPLSDAKRDEKHDEKEARMLVSDLLEIGIQQRKAYEDAKRKNAGAAPAQPLN